MLKCVKGNFRRRSNPGNYFLLFAGLCSETTVARQYRCYIITLLFLQELCRQSVQNCKIVCAENIFWQSLEIEVEVLVRSVVLVVRYEQYGAVCKLPLLTLSSIEKVLGSQPVLGSGRAGAGTHFNSALVWGERGGRYK